MLVTAVEARPLRQPRRGCGSSCGRGHAASVGPNGAGKTNLLEALYFALTGRSFRTGDRRDLIPFGEPLARAEATVRDDDGIERRFLASVSRAEGRRHLLDGSAADPATLARHRPARRGLLSRPAGSGQGPAGGAPRPPRRLRRRPLARRAPSCASASGRRWRSATRCSPGSPPARRPGATWTSWDATLAEAAAALIAARAEAVGGAGAALRRRRRRSSASTGGRGDRVRAPRRGRRRGDPRRPGASAARPTSGSAAAPGARTSTSCKIALDGRSLRRYGSQGQQRAALLALLFAEREALLRGPPASCRCCCSTT